MATLQILTIAFLIIIVLLSVVIVRAYLYNVVDFSGWFKRAWA